MNGVMMNGRLNPGVEPSLDRSGLEGDHEDHSLVFPPLAALDHISNGLCGSPDVTSSVKYEEPSVSWYQVPNSGWMVSMPPPRALRPVPISPHSVSVPPSWTECVILATCPGGGRDPAATVTDLPPSSAVLDVVTAMHPDRQGPERCVADTPTEMSDDPHSGTQRWTGGPKTVLMGGPKITLMALSNIAPTDLHLGDDPSLQPGSMVALDVVGRSGEDCDEPGILVESPTDSRIVPYLEPFWPVQPPIPIPLGATLPRVLVTGGGGVVGGPQGVEEDIHSVKDPSVPTPETNKKQDVEEKVLSCSSGHEYPRVMSMDSMTIVGKEKEKEHRVLRNARVISVKRKILPPRGNNRVSLERGMAESDRMLKETPPRKVSEEAKKEPKEYPFAKHLQTFNMLNRKLNETMKNLQQIPVESHMQTTEMVSLSGDATPDEKLEAIWEAYNRYKADLQDLKQRMEDL